MKVLMLTENDPAGMGIAFTNAINAHTEHSCRLITTAEKYCFGFRKDIHWPKNEHDFNRPCHTGYIEDLLENADIFHFHILSDESMEIGPFKVKDFIKGKSLVNHHHGHDDFRANPDKYRKKYRKLKRKVLVSTPDLSLGRHSSYWMPNLVPINDPLYMPTEERYPEFTIGHSPTRTDLKDTVTLLEAAHKAGVNVDIIMNTPHTECLKRKQKCHVIFDHLQGYYGVSSLEGLSMGKPVFAKLSLPILDTMERFACFDAPWVTTNKSGLHEDIMLYKNDSYRKYLGEGSRLFMEKYWSDKKVVNRLIKFYEGL